MRFRIIRILWLKEAWRHLADRGAIVLSFLLVGAALLVSIFARDSQEPTQLLGAVQLCYLDYWEGGPGNRPEWIEHLRRNRPTSGPPLNVRFRHWTQGMRDQNGRLAYQAAAGAIQVRVEGTDAAGRPRYRIWVWYPGEDPVVMKPYVDWFWRETVRYFRAKSQPVEILTELSPGFYPKESSLIQVKPEPGTRDKSRIVYWEGNGTSVFAGMPPPVEMEYQSSMLEGHGDMRTWFITALIFFPLWMFSVYLLPALTCEERERGVLLAQVLSPVRPIEIVAAKFFFYPPFGMALGALIAGISNPAVLTRPFFWGSVIVTAIGMTGLGMIIASLAKTQRRASLGAMLYLMVVALIMFMSLQFGVPLVKYLVLEFYVPRILHAALVNNMAPHRVDLLLAAILSFFWVFVAAYLFRRRGWQ
ncbi:MAG: ABC transporter permease [Gemmataceae bacterium]